MTDPAATGAVTDAPHYRRVMLKVSGEALMGDQGFGLHPPTVARIAAEVKAVHDMGVEICMVIGGGNIFRGLQGSAQGMERTTADYMGMLATVMNALGMQAALETLGVFTRVISAIPMDQICEPYIRRRAVGTWKRSASAYLPPAPATRISPPTRPLRCAPMKWPAMRSSWARTGWTGCMTRIHAPTRMPCVMTGSATTKR